MEPTEKKLGRPVILFQRLVVPASTTPIGTPGATLETDPTLMAAPEAMQVDYIFCDAEAANAGDYVIRPKLHERELWTDRPVPPTNLNNLARISDSNDYGEHWLQEPFILRAGHSITVKIENRMPPVAGVGRTAALRVVMQGMGMKSQREYSLDFDCNMPAGTAAGVRAAFGGREAYAGGREDILIKAVTWARKTGNDEFPDGPAQQAGWNPRLIGMSIEPSYGVKWSGPGGGGASSFVPLIVYSNIRGPRAAMFYKPAVDLELEQGDVLTLEVSPCTPNNGAIALVALVGTAIATGALPAVQGMGTMGKGELQVRS